MLWFAVFFVFNNANFLYVEVDGESMENTLYSGDVLCVNKKLNPSYGDIIVIDKVKYTPGKGYEYIIKRVIGLGGDKIEIKDGKVYRNDALLNESYANYAKGGNGEDRVWNIPEGKVFFLGDNRGNSSDSRVYGLCDESQIVGVVPKISLKLRPVTKFRVGVSVKFRELLGLG